MAELLRVMVVFCIPSYVFLNNWHFLVGTQLMYLDQKDRFSRECWHPLLLSKTLYPEMVSGLSKKLNNKRNTYFRTLSTVTILTIIWHQWSVAPGVSLHSPLRTSSVLLVMWVWWPAVVPDTKGKSFSHHPFHCFLSGCRRPHQFCHVLTRPQAGGAHPKPQWWRSHAHTGL